MEILALFSDWFITADVPITKTNVKPGWVALSIVVAMGVALFLLIQSMRRHTKRAEQPWPGENQD